MTLTTAMTTMLTLSLLLLKKNCQSFIVNVNSPTSPSKLQPSSTSLFHQNKNDFFSSPSPNFSLIESKENQTEESWEWDGVPIEGAHDAEFEPGRDVVDEEDMFAPSLSFMSMASSMASPALTAVSSTAASGFDSLGNAGNLHRRFLEKEDDEDDLLEMGGDPSFLADLDDGEVDVNTEINDSDFFEWDGRVDEDAHLDFD